MQDHNVHNQPMPEQPPRRRIPLGIAAGLSAVVLAVGGATAWWTWNASKTVDSSTQPTPDVVDTTPNNGGNDVISANEQNVEIYWVTDTGTNIELVPYQVSLATSENPTDTLAAAFEALLNGPMSGGDTEESATSIPAGTRLLSLDVRDDGVHVDLSEEFTSGGGSTSMTGRLAQVLYTASSLNPSEPVWISIAGEPLEVLGGEGLMVDQPMTRENFEQNFDL
jgi:spore germination protein GerM